MTFLPDTDRWCPPGMEPVSFPELMTNFRKYGYYNLRLPLIVTSLFEYHKEYELQIGMD